MSSFKAPRFDLLNCPIKSLRDEQIVVPCLTIMIIERAEHVGSLFEHLLRHRDGVAELLEVERGDSFGRRQRDDLIIDEAEEVFD